MIFPLRPEILSKHFTYSFSYTKAFAKLFSKSEKSSRDAIAQASSFNRSFAKRRRADARVSELKKEIYYILVGEVVIGAVENVENSKKPQKV